MSRPTDHPVSDRPSPAGEGGPPWRCAVCGGPVLGIPWHDRVPGDDPTGGVVEPTHQVCTLGRGVDGAARGGRWYGAVQQAPEDGWRLSLSDDGAQAWVRHEPSGREVWLTWARLRTIAVGNTLVLLGSSPRTVAVDEAVAGRVTGVFAGQRNAELHPVVSALGASAAVVAPEELLGARAVWGEATPGAVTVRFVMPWSVPAAVVTLASRGVGRGRR